MDFGLTDDQRDIQRTARELLGSRATPERVREHAEAGRTDDALWKELAELGWPGIAVAEEHGGQGLGAVELAILCEELGRSVAPVPFLPTVLAATLIEHAGSGEQRARWLPGLASGELTGAAGDTAALIHGGAGADVIVLVSGGEARLIEGGEVEPVASIDSTRPAARVTEGAGEPLAGDVEAATALAAAMRASLARCVLADPSNAASSCARLNSQCTSASQVKPMPPWSWIAAEVTSRPASEAAALAIAAASGRRSRSASAAQAAKLTAARAPSVSSSICAQRCDTAWNAPTGTPNWWRSFT